VSRSHWIVSAPFDLALLVGPALLSLVVLALSPADLFARDDLSVVAWLILIPLVDVSHVYASLYRTYFDAEELRRRRALYLTVPALAFVASTLLYSTDPRLFWTVLAYVAVFHFVRQQYGFLALYRRRAAEPAGWSARLDAALLYAATLYPLAWWHTHLPRKFVWFVEGDFVAIPARGVATALGWAYGAAALAYVAKEARQWIGGRTPSLGKNLLVAATALTWYAGIVHYDSDWSFTVTNVVSHGVPYVALVWIVCRRKWRASSSRSWMRTISQPRFALLFVAVLAALALGEEALWDRLVWGDHAAVFGRQSAAALSGSPALAFVVALLATPQATHYALDGFIWRTGRGNPGLRELLLGEGSGSTASSPAGRSRPPRP
jgi:hypothetical protein